MRTLDAYDTETLAMANALRGPAQGLGVEIGNEYVLTLSRCWKRYGIEGVRAACWSLMQLVSDVPGSWDIWVAARAVTWRTGP